MCYDVGTRTSHYEILGKGHTLMAADGIHGNIGKLFRKTSIVATFDNFVEVCKKANSNIEIITLDLLFI